jgi:hypothetical protein
MTDHDPTQLSAALRERVRDEDPDLDQLIQVSTRTGTRLRRRRTVVVSLAGAAAGVTVIGIVGASLGGSGGAPGSDPGFATQPTSSTSAPASATTRAEELDNLVTMLPTNPGDGQLPIRLDPRSLDGWRIGNPADDKFPASKGSYVLTVAVRPMSEYASWSNNDPDHPASQIAHVGDNYFVTVQPGPDVPQTVRDELVDALRFKPSWRK